MNPCTFAIAVFGVLAVILMMPTASTSIILNCGEPNESPKMREFCNYALEQARSGNAAIGNGDFLETYDRGAKRQDVDHVFLRFGRFARF